MAIKSSSVTVGTTAVPLHTPGSGRASSPQGVAIENRGAAAIFIGGADVTTANGMSVAANGYISIDVAADDVVYAISTAAGNDVRVVLTKS